MRSAFLFFVWMLAARTQGADLAKTLPTGCRQLVVVTAPAWSSSSATLQRFSRADGRARWEAVGKRVPALLGEHGLGWGLGLHEVPEDGAPRKVEGDRRAPAGIFRLTTIFAQTDRKDLPRLKLRFQAVTPSLEAVDDPASRFYNRIVDRSQISAPDWRSAEQMAAIPDYALGVVIGHNPENRGGAGSCIFLHLWLGTRRGTAGCTVLRRSDLEEVVGWLDAACDPVLVQLPVEAAREGFAEILK